MNYMVVPRGYVSQEQLASAIDQVRQKLGPEVVRLRYSVDDDHNDEPAIYFRIVLTDSASREETLGATTKKIREFLFNELQPYENWGLWLYVSFRSQSEQAKRDDPDWT